MSVPTFIKKRQNALLYTAGTVTSVYFASKWALSKFKQALISQSQSARDQQQLKKRFSMALQDAEFTIMSLVPVLEDSMWSHADQEQQKVFDVEGFTERLKALNAHLKRQKERTLLESSTATISDSVNSLVPDHPKPELRPPSPRLNPNASVFVPGTSSPDAPSPTNQTNDQPSYAQIASKPPQTDANVVADSSQANGTEESGVLVQHPQREVEDELNEPLSRAELWHEIKILTLTRYLTFLHTVSLLALLSTIQLSLLSRKSYVNSFRQEHHASNGMIDESRHPSPFDTSFPQEGSFQDDDLEKYLYGQQESEKLDAESEAQKETERAFLTMSWYLMNKRWTEVAPVVRERVEEQFASTSLKTVFSSESLFSALMSCLPPANPSDALPETRQDEEETLERGGGMSSAHLARPQLRRLLDETDDLLRSSDCATVLRSLQECMLKKMLTLTSSSSSSSSTGSASSANGSIEGFALARWLPLISSRNQIERAQALDCLKGGLFKEWAVLVYASWSDDQFDCE